MPGFTFPVKIMYTLVNAGIALLVAFPLGLSHHWVAVITTVVSAVAALVATIFTTPRTVAALTGAFMTAFVACLGFASVHLTSEQLGAATALVSVLLGLILHNSQTPIAAVTRRVRAVPPGSATAAGRPVTP